MTVVPVNLRFISQSYMKALTAAELEEALTEAQLAHPQWERAGANESFAGANQACTECGVSWRSDDEFTRCWNCDKPPNALAMPWIIGTLNPYSTRDQYEYADQPPTPASGCGCPDATPSRVAQLIGDGADLYAACLAVYGGTS